MEDSREAPQAGAAPSAEAQAQLARLAWRAEQVVPKEDLGAKLATGKPLRVKLGLDPTAAAVTLGWGVPLRKLRHFQDEGHTVVLIIGDFTAQIGDPSGKSETRKQLDKDTVRRFADSVLEQFADILSEDNLEIRYNSEWLEGMDLGALLGVTARYTVAQMLERDDFAKRYAAQKPISIIEFMYPLLQGYDSVAVEADVELGGTDQLFNLLVGRDLQKAYGQEPQVALTMPLLEGLDGVQKMSQSLNNYVGIRDEPADMFGKLMSLPDSLVGRYAALAAWLPDSEVDRLEGAVAGGGPEAGAAKREMARRTVALYRGDAAAAAAEEAFDAQFRRHEIPDDIPELTLDGDHVDEAGVFVPALLEAAGLVSSRGEARRLIFQGGVKLAGEKLTGEHVPPDTVRGSTLQVGKRRFVRII